MLCNLYLTITNTCMCLFFMYVILQLSSITDRMLRSCDFNIDVFLTEIDENLAASRAIFRNFDATFNIMSEEQWEEIQLKVVHY